MHRVGSVRPPLLSCFSQICRYSTETPPKPRQLITEWKGISIPSISELKARQKKPVLDISYLKDAPKNSLAGRLARRTDPLPEPLAESKPIPLDVIKLQTEKRREARIARENEKAAEAYSQVRKPVLNAEVLGKVVNAAEKPSGNKISGGREEAFLPRLLAWEPPAVQKRRPRRPETAAPRKTGKFSFRGGMRMREEEIIPIRPEVKRFLDSMNKELRYAEPASRTLVELFDVSPKLRLSSPRKPLNVPVDGDYSLYVPKSTETNFSTSVERLSPVDTASLALSHRADIAIPKRQHALSLIARATTGRSVKVEARA